LKTLAEKIPSSQPLISLDYFGAGHSDECICDEARDEFVRYEVFAAYALEICRKHNVTKFIPFGSLTGASIAIELAAQAAEYQVEKIILHDPVYLKPAAKEYVDNVYIPSIRHPELYVNGSHLLKAWFAPDGGPIGPSGKPVQKDLPANQVKAMDSMLNSRTGWQFKMGWTAWNYLHVPRLLKLAALNVKFMFIYGTFTDGIMNKYGLDHDWSEAQFNKTVSASLRIVHRICGGTEGVLEQNTTLVAQYLSAFLHWPDSVSTIVV